MRPPPSSEAEGPLNFEMDQTKSNKISGNQAVKPMTRGGRRSGAGRKKGSLSQKTRVIATRAAAEGITPLEVLLRTMRSAWARASKDGETVTNFQHALIAVAVAEKAAPFIHPRLAAERHEVSGADKKPSMPAPPQVILYLPDNGRDPDFANPVHVDFGAEDIAVLNGKANGHDPTADNGGPEGTEDPGTV